MPESKVSDPRHELRILVRSRYPIIQIESSDGPRIDALLQRVAEDLELPLFEWSRLRGLVRLDVEGSVYQTEEARKALEHIIHSETPALYHFRDLASSLPGDSLFQATLQEAARRLESGAGAILLSGEEPELPDTVRRLSAGLELPAPGREELRALLGRIVRDVSERQHVEVALTREETDRLLDQLRGLTSVEVEKVLTRAILVDGRLTLDDMAEVTEAKRRIVEREGVLEYYPTEDTLVRMAGMGTLEAWLRKRASILSDPDRAREFGLHFPRGILLVGVPGCGKSLSAKAVAHAWRLPLLKLDPSRIYNRYIGETEKNLRRATDLADRMAPLVLWIDEIEKALASGGSEDGGVSKRVLGSFLTWMQERRSPVFVVATSNDISALPPELLRKGRFDEIFFADLPEREARAAIVRIHMEARNQDPDGIDLETVAEESAGFSGAELEQVVVSALLAAFDEGGAIDTPRLVREVRRTRPLSVTAAERIAGLRAWAKGRTVPVA